MLRGLCYRACRQNFSPILQSILFARRHLPSFSRYIANSSTQKAYPSAYCTYREMASPSHTPEAEHASTGTTKIKVPVQDEQKLKQWFVGSIDSGTTSTRFLIFDGTGNPVASHQLEFKQMYPHPGWVDSAPGSHHTQQNVDRCADGWNTTPSR